MPVSVKLEESKAVEVRRLAIMLMVRAQQDQAACRQELCCGVVNKISQEVAVQAVWWLWSRRSLGKGQRLQGFDLSGVIFQVWSV